jgi:predicted DNA-binding protein YlxM (UPF0122 family)
MKVTDTETQLKILAMVARGDTLQEISDTTNVAVSTVQDIKARNKSSLALIQERMIDHQISSSKKILNKAHNLIERKLTKAEKADQEREELYRALEEGIIKPEEFRARLGALYEPTLTELNAVSRESFNQSQIEAGKPTSISNSPTEAKQQLVDLVQAIQAGDEVELYKMVLNPQHTPEVIEGEIK